MQNYILLKRKREDDGNRVEYEVFYNRKVDKYYKIRSKDYYNPALVGLVVVFSMIFKWLESIYIMIEKFLVSIGILGVISPFIIASIIYIYIEYRKFKSEFLNSKNILTMNKVQTEFESITKENIRKLYLGNWIKFLVMTIISFLLLLLLLLSNLSWGYRAIIYMLIWAFFVGSVHIIFSESLFSWKTAVVVVEQCIKQKLIKDNE